MVRCVFFTLCLSACILIGCRTTRPFILSDRSISYSEVQEITRSHHARIHSMVGEGRISVETPEIAQSGSFVLTLQKPDSVLINLQGPFGIKVGSALVTRTGFLFYNSLENKLITGLSSMENLNRILHVQLSFDDLLNLFAGGTFLENDFHAPDETIIEDNRFVFVFTSSQTSRKYWIEPTTWSIQKVQFLDQSGTLALEQTFSNFEDVNGFAMPYTIRIIQPKLRQKLTFTYSEILVNIEHLHFTFTIPPNAERIHW
jgi:outer membrane lipoprotein-sorting protein